jgi:Mor family transcriptional regulator
VACACTILKRLPKDHNLIDIMGKAAILQLVERFGGMDHFDIPQSGSYPHPPRNAEIREEWPSLGQRQLALKYALIARQVRKILAAEQPEEPEQMGLF